MFGFYRYFAYGSNLSREQMKARCPSSVLLGPAKLENYRLAFTKWSRVRGCGCADILPHVGRSVYGLVYALTEKDVSSMDEYEGHPRHYVRVKVKVIPYGEVFSYEVLAQRRRSDLKPSREYLEIIREASKTYNFPAEYRDMLLRVETL